MAQTVVPTIRTRKRRLVPPDKRKKASFSCDRCKVRKIACHRPTAAAPCTGCDKAGVACEITIQRKKKIRGPIENIGLHYKCLFALVRQLHPDVDANNIDALIDLGERRGYTMPSRYGAGDAKETHDLAFVITSGKRTASPEPNEPAFKSEDSDGVAPELPEVLSELTYHGSPPPPQDYSQLSHLVENPLDDYMILDLGGNTHCIGALGAPGVLVCYKQVADKAFGPDVRSAARPHRKVENVISSKHDPLQSFDLRFLYLKLFPYFGEMGRAAADAYVDTFFAHIHHRILVFDEQLFRAAHARFWHNLAHADAARSLSNHAICSIYMVWILGRLFDPGAPATNEATIQKYLHIVKLCLSELLLTPTLDGVRSLLLLSVYMDNRMRRESGYILLELAARQAMTLGFHRQAVKGCIKNATRLEEIRRTWWTIFIFEVCFSNQMGRTSCIHTEVINIELPLCLAVLPYAHFPAAFRGLVHLTIVLSEIVASRKNLSAVHGVFSDMHLLQACELNASLTSCFESLGDDLRDLGLDLKYKLALHFRYHYYRMLLTLPVFLLSLTVPDTPRSEALDALVGDALRACIRTVDLLHLADSHGLVNGTLFPDIFYAYHATMGLVAAYFAARTQHFTPPHGVVIEEVESAIATIKQLELLQAGGTLSKMVALIHEFVAGYELMKGRDEPHRDFAMPVLPFPLDGDLFSFGGQGFGEMSIGTLDFGVLAASEVDMFDAGLSDNLFRIDQR